MKELLRNNGFTLIESLIAIAILLLTIVAPMSIAQRGIAVTNFARNEIVAQYLAQDAADFITALKETNEVNETADWLEGLRTCDDNAKCLLDTITGNATACTSPCTTALIRYNPATGYYSYQTISGDTLTVFKRVISIADCSQPNQCISGQTDEARVGVAVSWGSSLYPSNSGLNDATNLDLRNGGQPSTKGNSYVLRFSLYKTVE